MVKTLLTSESVGAGHPDKVCDIVSDSILDAVLAADVNGRVACETWVKDNALGVIGEITTSGKIDFQKIARQAVRKIGYTNAAWGMDADSFTFLNLLGEQSPDIAMGVDVSANKEQGAGDQGTMWGYATDETPEFMPLPIILSHRLAEKLASIKSELSYVRPDCKTQVAVIYEDDKPVGIHNVVIAIQHEPNVKLETLREDIIRCVIRPVCGKWILPTTEFIINGTGRFEIGGPKGDAGLTGRKIIVDTYGGIGRHGGGAFSGKDPSKVDRSGAYMVRYIAKNIVASGLARKCEVQVSYCIGVAAPTSVYVNTLGTGKVPDHVLTDAVLKIFPLKPAQMIAHLKLKTPSGWSYAQTAAYGHFGRSHFPWEKTDKTSELLALLK